MRVLLDTCTYVWFYSDPNKLSEAARARIADPATVLYLSVVNVWEILVKQQTGRADAPPGDVIRIATQHIEEDALNLLPLNLLHPVHRDPWDQMLVCQAQAEGLAILTPDHFIQQYPVAWEW